ncbi:MAG: autotransporter domain-containing protein [Alphaproteobacteria bacterium]|jgi:outer membrane autotransporter protein
MRIFIKQVVLILAFLVGSFFIDKKVSAEDLTFDKQTLQEFGVVNTADFADASEYEDIDVKAVNKIFERDVQPIEERKPLNFGVDSPYNKDSSEERAKEKHEEKPEEKIEANPVPEKVEIKAEPIVPPLPPKKEQKPHKKQAQKTPEKKPVVTDKTRALHKLPEGNSIVGTKKNPQGVMDAKTSNLPTYPSAYEDKYKSKSPYSNPAKHDPEVKKELKAKGEIKKITPPQKVIKKEPSAPTQIPASTPIQTNSIEEKTVGNPFVKTANAEEIGANLEETNPKTPQKPSIKPNDVAEQRKEEDFKTSNNEEVAQDNSNQEANENEETKKPFRADRNNLKELKTTIPTIPRQDIDSLEEYAKEFEFSKDRVKYDVKAYMNRTNQNADKGKIGYDARQNGVYMEAGGIFAEDLRLGVAYGYSVSNINIDSGPNDDVDITSNYTGLTFHYDLSKYYVDGSAGAIFSNYETARGSNGSIKGKTDGINFVSGLGGGFRVPLTNGLLLVPNGWLRYTKTKNKSYTDSAGVGFDDLNVSKLVASLGSKLQYPMIWNGKEILPEFRFNLMHDLLNESRKDSNLLVLPGNNIFGPVGGRYRRDVMNFGLGLRAKMIESFFLTADYDYETDAGGNLNSHSFQAGFDMSF